MRAIHNPFQGREGYFCFGCSQGNPCGLRMQFAEEPDGVTCRWKPDSRFQGFSNVLHGGIQATLMDELASWVVFVKLKTAGVTTRMETTFHRPVFISAGELSLKGAVQKVARNIVTIRVELKDGGGRLCAESAVSYFLYPPDAARRRLGYPGYERFFPQGEEAAPSPGPADSDRPACPADPAGGEPR